VRAPNSFCPPSLEGHTVITAPPASHGTGGRRRWTTSAGLVLAVLLTLGFTAAGTASAEGVSDTALVPGRSLKPGATSVYYNLVNYYNKLCLAQYGTTDT
jgi:hypothetical protein